MFKDEIYDIREQKIAHAVTSMIEQHTAITGFYYRQVVLSREKGLLSKNLTIMIFHQTVIETCFEMLKSSEHENL